MLCLFKRKVRLNRFGIYYLAALNILSHFYLFNQASFVMP